MSQLSDVFPNELTGLHQVRCFVRPAELWLFSTSHFSLLCSTTTITNYPLSRRRQQSSGKKRCAAICFARKWNIYRPRTPTRNRARTGKGSSRDPVAVRLLWGDGDRTCSCRDPPTFWVWISKPPKTAKKMFREKEWGTGVSCQRPWCWVNYHLGQKDELPAQHQHLITAVEGRYSDLGFTEMWPAFIHVLTSHCMWELLVMCWILFISIHSSIYRSKHRFFLH